MLRESGLWWEGKENGNRILLDNTDFSKREAEEIFAQVGSYASICSRRGRYDIVDVTVDGNKYLVLINAHGAVELPVLQNGRKGKTTNPKDIPTYVHCYREENRKRLE